MIEKHHYISIAFSQFLENQYIRIIDLCAKIHLLHDLNRVHNWMSVTWYIIDTIHIE